MFEPNNFEKDFSRTTGYSLSAATMDTTMDVLVEELCTSTVARTPIIRLDIGFERMALLEKASPTALPEQKNILCHC